MLADPRTDPAKTNNDAAAKILIVMLAPPAGVSKLSPAHPPAPMIYFFSFN